MTLARLCLALVISLVLAASATAATAPTATDQDATGQILVLLRLPPPHLRPNGDYAGSYGDEAGQLARRRSADRLAQSHGLKVVKSWPMPLLGVDCFIMAVPPGRGLEAEAAAMSREPAVEWAEPSHTYHAKGAEPTRDNDPLFAVQPAAQEWRLADLHQMATGRGVPVAIIDSRVQVDHPDLAGQILLSKDFVADRPGPAEAHGTAVAGVIAAKAGNRLGIAGVAPEARLMALRACWQGERQPVSATTCDTLSLALALHFAIDHGAQVINLSLSGPPDPLLGKLIDVAISRGATVVSAFDPSLPSGGFPASHAGVVAVAEEALARPPSGVYSAPGRDVPTTEPGGRWCLVNGSSYAAAHVSGLFALVRQRNPRNRTAAALASRRGSVGAIDACATLLRAAGACDCACARLGSR